MSSNWYSITEMAAAYGTTLRALRFYEQKGILSPTRVAGQRRYSAADRIRLELILKGVRLGFTLTEIKRLIEARATTAVGRATQSSDLLTMLNRDEIHRLIEELQRKRDDLQKGIDDLGSAIRSQTPLPPHAL